MALGVQDKFSWGAVAAGALSSAATAYIGGAGSFGNGAVGAMKYAVTSNVVSQGINILTGQQRSFSWKSVAASAISAGIAHEVGNGLFGGRDVDTGLRTGAWAKANPTSAVFAESAVRAGISATTRVAISGGRVSWEAVAADTVSGFVHGMGGVERARQMGRIGSDGGLMLGQSEALGGPADTRYATEAERQEVENGRLVNVSGGSADVIRLSAGDAGPELDADYLAYRESAKDRAISYEAFAEARSSDGRSDALRRLDEINGIPSYDPQIVGVRKLGILEQLDAYVRDTQVLPYATYDGDWTNNALAFVYNAAHAGPVNLASTGLSLIGDGFGYLESEWKIPQVLPATNAITGIVGAGKGAVAVLGVRSRVVATNSAVVTRLGPNFDETGNLTADAAKLYARPSGFRKGVREQAWENAKAADGNVYDPVTNRVMKFDEPWDMGHAPRYEFRKHQVSAAERLISRKQFLNEHNNPTKYRPELPSSNRSHKGEDLTDSYFGD